jgi:hypothetical protein
MRRRVKTALLPSCLLFCLCLFVAAQSLSGDEASQSGGSQAPEALLTHGPWRLDAGGQVRVRGDFAGNQDFTDFTFSPGHREAQFLKRSRLHGSVENTELNLKLFLEPQWYGRWGGWEDRSDVDLYQGFLEWGKVLDSPVTLKAGRQELSYGSTFFIGPNDFYNGLSWDGLKASFSPTDRLTVDLMGVRMAELNPGDPENYLAGLYATYKVFEESSLDGYLFYNKGGFPFFHREFQVTEPDHRLFTFGARFSGKVAGFDYEVEPQVQWGSVRSAVGKGEDRFRAFGGHADVGYTFNVPWEPRIFAAYAFGSGDNDPFDGKFREFHGNVFNDNYLVGDMSVISDLSGVTANGAHASGMHVWVAGISVTPFAGLNLSLDVHRFVARKVPSSFSKELGVEVNLVASYKATKELSFLLGLNRFFAGRFFEHATGSGKNIDYAYVQTQVEF